MFSNTPSRTMSENKMVDFFLLIPELNEDEKVPVSVDIELGSVHQLLVEHSDRTGYKFELRIRRAYRTEK